MSAEAATAPQLTTFQKIKIELAALREQVAEQSDEIRSLRADVLAAIGSNASSPRERYSVEEAATLLGKSPYTTRELCRLGRIRATKRAERRGGAALWSVSVEEIRRVKEEGLLPIDPTRNASAH